MQQGGTELKIKKQKKQYYPNGQKQVKKQLAFYIYTFLLHCNICHFFCIHQKLIKKSHLSMKSKHLELFLKDHGTQKTNDYYCCPLI